MPRPPVERILGSAITARVFRPTGATRGDGAAAGAGPADDSAEIVLSLDEAEALRLADLDGLYQQAAALRMGVSRQTFGRIIESARRKTSDALLNGKVLRIGGGPVALASGPGRPPVLAVPTTAEGSVEEHFGHSVFFSLFTIAGEGGLLAERRFEPPGSEGCRPGLIAALAGQGVTHFLVGRIGEGALRVSAAHGICVLRGARGAAREVAQAFLRGEFTDQELGCGGAPAPGSGRACQHGGPGCPGWGRGGV